MRASKAANSFSFCSRKEAYSFSLCWRKAAYFSSSVRTLSLYSGGVRGLLPILSASAGLESSSTADVSSNFFIVCILCWLHGIVRNALVLVRGASAAAGWQLLIGIRLAVLRQEGFDRTAWPRACRSGGPHLGSGRGLRCIRRPNPFPARIVFLPGWVRPGRF